MKIVIVGAGALGGYVGALLSESGVELTLYDVRADYVAQVQAEGLTLSPLHQPTKTYHPKITADLGALAIPDALILATKAYHTQAALLGAKNLVGPETLVCSFQNGYGNLELIAELVGDPARIVAMTTAHNFLVLGPTHIQSYTGAGGVDLGLMAGGKPERLMALGELMKALKLPVKVHDSAAEVVWNKILWNAVLNCTAAVTGLDVISMVNTPAIQPLLKDLAAEYFAVSAKMGVKVWHPPNFVDLMIFGAKAAIKMQNVAPPKPSMLQDLEAGRPTEIDYINGAIVSMGEKHGVPAPVNKTMTAIVKTIEGKAKK